MPRKITFVALGGSPELNIIETILSGEMRAIMKKVGMVALSVLLAISGMQVSADPMAERQAQLEKEREAYMQGLERQNNAATLGWHWYQDPAEQEVDEAAPDEEAPAQPTPAPNEEMVQIDVKWLRENLPKMLDDAMNNPGDMQKVKLYWLAQKWPWIWPRNSKMKPGGCISPIRS